MGWRNIPLEQTMRLFLCIPCIVLVFTARLLVAQTPPSTPKPDRNVPPKLSDFATLPSDSTSLPISNSLSNAQLEMENRLLKSSLQ